MGWPQIDWYHRAFSLSQLSKWNVPETSAPAWVAMEEELVKPFSMQAFLTDTVGDIPYRNPALSFPTDSWKRAHEICNIDSCHTNGSSIWYNN